MSNTKIGIAINSILNEKDYLPGIQEYIKWYLKEHPERTEKQNLKILKDKILSFSETFIAQTVNWAESEPEFEYTQSQAAKKWCKDKKTIAARQKMWKEQKLLNNPKRIPESLLIKEFGSPPHREK